MRRKQEKHRKGSMKNNKVMKNLLLLCDISSITMYFIVFFPVYNFIFFCLRFQVQVLQSSSSSSSLLLLLKQVNQQKKILIFVFNYLHIHSLHSFVHSHLLTYETSSTTATTTNSTTIENNNTIPFYIFSILRL